MRLSITPLRQRQLRASAQRLRMHQEHGIVQQRHAGTLPTRSINPLRKHFSSGLLGRCVQLRHAQSVISPGRFSSWLTKISNAEREPPLRAIRSNNASAGTASAFTLRGAA